MSTSKLEDNHWFDFFFLLWKQWSLCMAHYWGLNAVDRRAVETLSSFSLSSQWWGQRRETEKVIAEKSGKHGHTGAKRAQNHHATFSEIKVLKIQQILMIQLLPSNEKHGLSRFVKTERSLQGCRERKAWYQNKECEWSVWEVIWLTAISKRQENLHLRIKFEKLGGREEWTVMFADRMEGAN